jgi:hypothetical protein
LLNPLARSAPRAMASSELFRTGGFPLGSDDGGGLVPPSLRAEHLRELLLDRLDLLGDGVQVRAYLGRNQPGHRAEPVLIVRVDPGLDDGPLEPCLVPFPCRCSSLLLRRRLLAVRRFLGPLGLGLLGVFAALVRQ